MDVLEELDMSAALISALHLDIEPLVDLLIEYKPIRIIAKFGFVYASYLDKIPHVLGKPQTQCLMIKKPHNVGGQIFIWIYNGFLTHLLIKFGNGYLYYNRHYKVYINDFTYHDSIKSKIYIENLDENNGLIEISNEVIKTVYDNVVKYYNDEMPKIDDAINSKYCDVYETIEKEPPKLTLNIPMIKSQADVARYNYRDVYDPEELDRIFYI